MSTTTQTDTDNAFDWHTIETTLHPDGSVYRVFTTFDSGLTRLESNSGYFTGNFNTTINIDDSASQLFDWERQSFTVDPDGAITNTGVVYDNGTSVYETFVDGILSVAIQNDWGAVSLYDWDRIQSFYDANGTVYRQITNYDDTSRKTDTFADGLLSSSTRTDTAENAANWDTIQTIYDTATGQMDLKVTTYDDGVKRYDTYSNGARIEVLFDDRDDVKPWETIEITYGTTQDVKVTTYDNGMVQTEETLQNGRFQIVDKQDIDNAFDWTTVTTNYVDGAVLELQTITDYDNGSSREDYFADGVRITTRQMDSFFDTGAYDWETIDTYYDEAGDIAFRETQYDDGSHKTEDFEGGQLSLVTQTDLGSAQSYEVIRTYYEDGAIAFRETTLDDGFAKTEQFNAGVRAVTQEDDTVGDVKNFVEKTTYYDETGALAFRETTFDTGLFRTEEFLGGVRVQTQDEDRNDAFSWAARTTSYDENGTIAFRAQTFDNGVQRSETFVDGQRTVLEEQDMLNATNWVSRGTQFDPETGDILLKGEERDNGVALFDIYEDGVREARLLEDTADAFVWAQKGTQFAANGDREIALTGFDNGDGLVDIYADGVRDFRLEMDDDGDQAWAFRLTEYDAAGQNGQRTTFDSADDIPLAYADALDLVQYWDNPVAVA